MATKRKAISKMVRFEVFKRDGFKCQYCGAHPPSVLLHIDHINPVASGGGNEIDNLLTACEPCNLGKGARSLAVVPQSLAEKAALVSEREAQLRGYQEIMEDRLDRIEGEMWRVAEIIETGSSKDGMLRDWLGSIKKFNDRLGLHAVMEAADIARSRYTQGGKKTFLYFCGICWSRIRELEGTNA